MFAPHEIGKALNLVVIFEHCSEARLACISFSYLKRRDMMMALE